MVGAAKGAPLPSPWDACRLLGCSHRAALWSTLRPPSSRSTCWRLARLAAPSQVCALPPSHRSSGFSATLPSTAAARECRARARASGTIAAGRWHFGGAPGQSNLGRLDRLVGSMDASSTHDEIYLWWGTQIEQFFWTEQAPGDLAQCRSWGCKCSTPSSVLTRLPPVGSLRAGKVPENVRENERAFAFPSSLRQQEGAGMRRPQ